MTTLANLTASSTKIEKIRVVMKTAHKLFKQENWFKTWSETLKEAWSMVKDKMFELTLTTLGKQVDLKTLNNMLINESDFVTFGYYKLNGEFRVFKATKNFDIIPTDQHPAGSSTAPNLRFYDDVAKQWRGLAKNTQFVYMM